MALLLLLQDARIIALDLVVKSLERRRAAGWVGLLLIDVSFLFEAFCHVIICHCQQGAKDLQSKSSKEVFFYFGALKA